MSECLFFTKTRKATSASQSTEISRAFLSKPDLLFENETCLLILFSILFNSTLPLPINQYLDSLSFSVTSLCYQFQSDEEEQSERKKAEEIGTYINITILHTLLEDPNIFGGYLVFTILVYNKWITIGESEKKEKPVIEYTTWFSKTWVVSPNTLSTYDWSETLSCPHPFFTLLIFPTCISFFLFWYDFNKIIYYIFSVFYFLNFFRCMIKY